MNGPPAAVGPTPGSRHRDIICQTQTLAAQEPMPQRLLLYIHDFLASKRRRRRGEIELACATRTAESRYAPFGKS